MRTIVEMSTDYLENDSALAFIDGAEFVQRWIPIEDELPENNTTILVTDNGRSPIRSTALFKNNKFYPDFVLDNIDVTHWRPIEFK